MLSRLLVLAALAVAATPLIAQKSITTYAPAVRAECFPVETLAAADRALAEEWLLGALDREGLYTLASDLKPMSSGVRTFKYSVTTPDLTEIDQARRIASTFRCGDRLTAVVQLFASESKGERFAEIVFVNRRAFDAELVANATLFAARGLSPGVDPEQALTIVEFLPREDRFRAYGQLFGFPDYAVEFFAKATTEGTNVGAGKDRDFYQVPVFKGASGFFVWAVPLGHVERPEDRTIRERALTVLDAYRGRRERYIGEGKAGGAGALLRDWLCESGLCQ